MWSLFVCGVDERAPALNADQGSPLRTVVGTFSGRGPLGAYGSLGRLLPFVLNVGDQ